MNVNKLKLEKKNTSITDSHCNVEEWICFIFYLFWYLIFYNTLTLIEVMESVKLNLKSILDIAAGSNFLGYIFLGYNSFETKK